MRPQKIGRALGIGLRVAGRVVGRSLAGQAQPAAQPPQNQRVAEAGAGGRAAGQAAGRASRGVARGVGGFLRPFRHVGGIIWLEMAGVFFLLPLLVFCPTLWRARADWAHGPEHGTFVISAVVIAIFLYLSISSFWRAWRK